MRQFVSGYYIMTISAPAIAFSERPFPRVLRENDARELPKPDLARRRPNEVEIEALDSEDLALRERSLEDAELRCDAVRPCLRFRLCIEWRWAKYYDGCIAACWDRPPLHDWSSSSTPSSTEVSCVTGSGGLLAAATALFCSAEQDRMVEMRCRRQLQL